MITEHRAVTALRVFLVLLFALLVFFQTFALPGQFAYMAEQSPDRAYLRWPMTAVAVFLVLCMQVVILSTWKLLTLVETDRIFSEVAFRWVDVIVWAVGAGWVVLLGALTYVALTWDDPGLPLLLILSSTGVAVLGLLMVVMRALLRRATALRADMEAVI